MERTIQYLKNKRKQRYLDKKYGKTFAFIGIGNHSINNLYPVIAHLRLDLKYIVTLSRENAQKTDKAFQNIIGTNDLDMVLNDETVRGIFICTQPKHHFQLVQKALNAGKNVFVDKPPCLTSNELDQLIETEKQSGMQCVVGMQKRFAPVNLALKEHTAKNCHYNYRFTTGAYPEGDPIMDMFIHPINLASFLFGSAKIASATVHTMGKALTVFLQLVHQNNICGSIELSTAYSWGSSQEELVVNTPNGTFKATNTEELTLDPKPGTILGLPKEKLLGTKRMLTCIIRRDSFSPLISNNQIYTSGYYGEVEHFATLCNNRKIKSQSSLLMCKDTFQLLTVIKEKVHV